MGQALLIKEREEMSFSAEVKNELARIDPEKECCSLAEITGFLRVAGILKLYGGGRYGVLIDTDNPAIARHYKKLIKSYFKVDPKLQVAKSENANLSDKKRYILDIGPEEMSEQILRETGILFVKQGKDCFSEGIADGIVRTKCCKRAFLRGAFLGAGTMSDPKKGYHLEIVCKYKDTANDLRRMINTFEKLSAKVTERKGKYVVYIKTSQYIRDTLAIMEAHSHVLMMDDTMLTKQLKGNAVRLSNCDNANTDRALDAAEFQLKAINKIKEEKGLDSLSPKLRAVAELRLKYPEDNLTQLGERLEPPLKKSGMSGRMEKIIGISGLSKK